MTDRPTPAGTPRWKRGAVPAAIVATAVAAAAPIVLPHLERWEGLENRPYRDIAGITTWCIGETQGRPKAWYSDAECRAMASGAVETRYGPPVVQCVPALADPARRHQLAASILLAYNIGSAAYCRSTAARRFNAGDWRGGCDAFLKWRFVQGREVRGLVNRRHDERRLCLKGL